MSGNGTEAVLREEEDVDVLDNDEEESFSDNSGSGRVVTREQAIEAIVTDPAVAEHLGFTPDAEFASRVIDWINETVVEQSRVLDYGWVFPSTERMLMPEYRGFDALFGHNETPEVGSAGDVVQRHLLKGNETGIWHDLVGEGRLAHCGARVLVGSV